MSNLIRPVNLALLATRLPAGQAAPVAATVPRSGLVRANLDPKNWALPPSPPRPRPDRPTRAKIRENIVALQAKRDLIRLRMVKEKGLRLDYAPINLEVYVLSYNGALAGFLGGRISTNPNPSAYAEQAAAAGVWAQEFDTIWGDAAAIDEAQAEIILLGSYSTWFGRSPQALVPTQVDALITAVIAQVTEAEIFYASQGITPALWMSGGGGGGGTFPTPQIADAGGTVDIGLNTYSWNLSASATQVTYQLPIDTVPTGHIVSWEYEVAPIILPGVGALLISPVTGATVASYTYGSGGNGPGESYEWVLNTSRREGDTWWPF